MWCVFFFVMSRRPPICTLTATLFPYSSLFRSNGDDPADRGGATRWGITERVARQHGYAGAMRAFPRDEAAAIYRRLYWLRPRFDAVAARAPALAAELDRKSVV